MMRSGDARQRRAPRRQRPVMQQRRRPDEQTQPTNDKNGVETRVVLRATAERGTRAIRAPRNTANATQNTDASQRKRVEGPKPRARKARRTQQHANETRHATARTGRKSGTQRMKHSAATQPVRDGRTTRGRIPSTRSKQTRPLTLLDRNFPTRRLNAKKAHRMRRHTYKQRAAQ